MGQSIYFIVDGMRCIRKYWYKVQNKLNIYICFQVTQVRSIVMPFKDILSLFSYVISVNLRHKKRGRTLMRTSPCNSFKKRSTENCYLTVRGVRNVVSFLIAVLPRSLHLPLSTQLNAINYKLISILKQITLLLPKWGVRYNL